MPTTTENGQRIFRIPKMLLTPAEWATLESTLTPGPLTELTYQTYLATDINPGHGEA